ncbi:ornithine-acyl[acyl carrier protein] N-acyltransferase [Sulfuritortus calidifontis]|uniref:L-ornithine N(alpha)-acyltransferase n=1 Tax=Sulfuritortus calidifontis TaxID=1914471 RepID=A0A4R3K0K6_9PROT|nr:GNAT family N-acyltransferase [Sulfuritortus calidifontis]TCS73295.1 ornithine-acyl[acyl carrier protein] N-acyltransferase [Sulfuritortus calidifontis]
MLQERVEAGGRVKRHYQVGLADSPEAVREAQRLRYKVFAEEMGARLSTVEPGLDIDFYDPHCQHLLVRDADTGEVVGTYRILSPEAAKRIGSYYTEQEFDLTRLQHLRGRMVELGRSCVHADHRSGGVIALLWAGLAEYMLQHGYDYLIGCASIGMADGGHNAAGIWHTLKDKHLSPVEWRVTPRCPLPLESLETTAAPVVPPLIKGYLRAGAYICGEPAWDPDFNTADLPILLSMKSVNGSYARHFLK